MHHPTDRIAHTTAFVTPVVEHWLEHPTFDTALYKMLNAIVDISERTSFHKVF